LPPNLPTVNELDSGRGKHLFEFFGEKEDNSSAM